jgi:hypothetical protein
LKENAMVRTTVDAWQGVLALVGITLGVIPLIQKLLTGSTGSLWQLLVGGGEGVPALITATVVAIGTGAAVIALERRKRR